MNKNLSFLILLLFLSIAGHAQTDSLLLSMQDTTPAEPLIPSRMLLSQRILWGEKGLLRLTHAMPLNEKNRQIELRLRRTMLVAHQVDGFVTLGCMVAQGIIGSRLYTYKLNGNPENNSGYSKLQGLHESMAAVVNLTYFSTAALSLFSPPPVINRKTKKLSSITLHKYLAIVHFTSMLATNLLASEGPHSKLKPYHRAAAYTAFASFATAMIVMKF